MTLPALTISCRGRNPPIALSRGRHAINTPVPFYMRTPSGFDIESSVGGEQLGTDLRLE